MEILMGLNNYDKEKLMHDVKRLGRGFRILRDEDKPERREFICLMLQDELDRVTQDIEEMTEKLSGEEE